MAEICLECWNKINGTNDSPRKYIISKDLDLCEECGEWKNVIVMTRKAYCLRKIHVLIIPTKISMTILLLPFVPLILLVRKLQNKIEADKKIDNR